MKIEYTTTAIHGTDGRSAMARLLTTCDHCAAKYDILRWNTGYGDGEALMEYWNRPTKMYRADAEPIDVWTRRVFKEYVESKRATVFKGDGDAHLTSGIEEQIRTNVLSMSGLPMRPIILSDFLAETYRVELSSIEKFIITHPNSRDRLPSGDSFIDEGGVESWIVADRWMPDNGRAYVMDANCLGTMSLNGSDASCICPMLKDERAFGVIRF